MREVAKMLSIIKNAIEGRRILEIYYPPGRRLVEPHTLGYGADGSLLLRAFQNEGASASGEHVNWKLFRVDRARELEPSGNLFFGPRPGYRKGDSAMKGGIIVEM